MVSRSNIRIRGEVLKALALSSLDSGDSGNSGTLRGLIEVIEVSLDSFDWISGSVLGIQTHGLISRSLIWNRGVGVPVPVMVSRSVGGVTVAAVADTAAQSSAPSSLRSAINRQLQILSLVIFRSTFALKIFAQDLNRYALMYCSRNAAVFETISCEIDRLSSFSRRRSSLNDEPYALIAVIQKLVSKICVVSDVRRGVILMI